eukprot:TRINITY_DN4993_c0_g1_i5.p1 TRINITY_DN4993_c0_g1~~TRINITY_DN4993_c0_g1_i5.p1  ORF type:complete len:736 (-),score=189.58 TRINITY_DN4993_c0_g1_i5:188-2395(-)
MVVYGGATGGGSLASDDLFLLDLKGGEESASWSIVPVVGQTPGRRYGHSITYSKPFLIVFGGNTGSEAVNDYWAVNVEKSPYTWAKLESKGDTPMARVYHSAALCVSGTASGMIVVFGGRGADSSALNDSWGLRRHRDGRWDWVKAPYKPDRPAPLGRYQHSSLFLGTLLLVIGGRTNNVGETVPLEIYDTETSEWHRFNAVQRFRHASWIVDANLYVYGGFEQDSPNVPTDMITKVNMTVLFEKNDALRNRLAQMGFHSPSNSIIKSNSVSPNISPKETTPNLSPNASPNTSFENVNRVTMGAPQGTGFNRTVTLGQSGTNQGQAKSGAGGRMIEESKRGEESRVKKIPIINAEERGKTSVGRLVAQNQMAIESQIHMLFLIQLLQPKQFINLPENAKFNFRPEHIVQLCDAAENIIMNQKIVLRIRAPIKIFGDIHGQYSDLMRFFDLWGSPCDGQHEGDIEAFDYLFLGDFVDRGSHSLETICVLLALKVRYPEQVHLIRGNHEDRWINNGFGFSEECAIRLGEDPNEDDSVFNRVNRLFDYLPLAAVIEEKVVCLHGGIGASLNYIEDIEQLQRPLEVIHEVSTQEQQLVVDILWSDPTDSDLEIGIHPNTIRDPSGTGNIVKFGPDRVKSFLANNNLSLIVRAHECVMDGFERFAAGSLITVFSATDYCGKHKNAGAVLIMKKNFEIIPKLIYPSNNGINNWMEDEESLKKRPPTPPRWKNTAPRKSSYE